MFKKIKNILKKSDFINNAYNKYLFLKSDFYKFEKSINKTTWINVKRIIKWSDECLRNIDKTESEICYKNCADEIVTQGFKLKNVILKKYKNKLNLPKIRFLIDIPDLVHSPGGYSLFLNFVDSLKYIGINSKPLFSSDNYCTVFNEFKPSVFITSDNKSYLEKFDWSFIKEYKKNNLLKVGLTANLDDESDTPLLKRLEWSNKNQIDFYYYYSPDEYKEERKKDYKPFFDYGYDIISMEYGVNALKYYPVPDIEKDIDYIFLGSSNKSKQRRYIEYFSNIFKNYSGFLYGPGWSKVKVKFLNTDRDRYLYARSKIGLNINLKKQIEWAYNLNERTYMLAACGTPQLTDKPKLLLKKFDNNSMFIAETPNEYYELFEFILANPEEAQKKALSAQKEVFENHTTFHRAEKFINNLLKIFPELK